MLRAAPFGGVAIERFLARVIAGYNYEINPISALLHPTHIPPTPTTAIMSSATFTTALINTIAPNTHHDALVHSDDPNHPANLVLTPSPPATTTTI